MKKEKAIAEILRYHEQTKHHPDRFARGPGHMDWANEPVPFRFYEGISPIRLPLLRKDPDADYLYLYERSRHKPAPFTLKSIASMFELSMGLSAWKEYKGSKWALRMNPSSGNLHPTEAYVILPPLSDLEDRGGVFHYNAYLHGLEPRIHADKGFWNNIKGHFGTDVFFVGLSSIHWRESWKYGERAFRYCNQDVGHAVACISFASTLHGWKASCLTALSDLDAEIILGFDRTPWKPFEKEYADLMIILHRNDAELLSLDFPSSLIRDMSLFPCRGKPNVLSMEHRDWGIIDAVASAAEKMRTEPFICPLSSRPFTLTREEIPAKKAAAVIRQRRSAQAFDGKTGIQLLSFLSLLEKTIPAKDRPPFDTCIGGTDVHLLLFVHRVFGLEQGLYFLVRNGNDLSQLKENCRKSFVWQKVQDTPDASGLYLLEKGDFRDIAATAGCFQDIAADGAFAAAMIAKFKENIEQEPYLYRKLHWEAGMIGQVLYLEAEAHGLRGTGIGCFLDDVAHELLGFEDDAYQDIYHFTIGGPLEDHRLTTWPPYYHLASSQQK